MNEERGEANRGGVRKLPEYITFYLLVTPLTLALIVSFTSVILASLSSPHLSVRRALSIVIITAKFTVLSFGKPLSLAVTFTVKG